MQLRRSLLSRIRDTVKSGGKDFKLELADLMASWKKEAASDMSQAEMEVRAARKRVHKDQSVSEKSQKRGKKGVDEATTVDGENSEPGSMGSGEEDEELDPEQSGSSVKQASKAASVSLCSGKSGKPAIDDLEEGDDNDLFPGKFGRFRGPSQTKPLSDESAVCKADPGPKAAPEKEADNGMVLSDELQEMLAEVVSNYLARDADS